MAKRRNWILLDMVRYMMGYYDQPKFVWGSTLETTIYILNSVKTKSITNTPVEFWTSRKASI